MPKMKYYNGSAWVALDAANADTVGGLTAAQLGSKLTRYTGRTVIVGSLASTPVPIAEYNSTTDVMDVYLGGIYQTPALDFTYSSGTNTITKVGGTWNQDEVVDFVVYKNITAVPTGAFDGAFLIDGSVARQKLHATVIAELNGLSASLAVVEAKQATGSTIYLYKNTGGAF